MTDALPWYKPAFILELGREKGALEPLSPSDIIETLTLCREGINVLPDRTTMTMPVETFAGGHPSARFELSDTPKSPHLSPPALVLHIPWGCPDDEISRFATVLHVVMERHNLTIYHDDSPVHNPLESLTELYTDSWRRTGQELKSMLDKSGIITTLLKPVRLLEVCIRTASCLRNLKTKIVADIVTRSEANLLGTPNFGRKCLTELNGILTEELLKLEMELDMVKFCDTVSHVLPRDVVENVSSTPSIDAPPERSFLLALADVLAMSFLQGQQAAKPAPRPVILGRVEIPTDYVRVLSPAEIIKKTHAETMRILKKTDTSTDSP